MLIPKWSVRALLLLSAAFLGWMLHVSMGDGPERSAPEAAATRSEPASHAAVPRSAPANADSDPRRPPVYVSVVRGGTGTSPNSPAAASSPVEPPGGGATTPEGTTQIKSVPAGSSVAETIPPLYTPVPMEATSAAPPSGGESAPGFEPRLAPLPVGSPPDIRDRIFTPVPGVSSRAVSISEWETSRSDVAGTNIIQTTDDSNVSVDRIGDMNGNTGDVDTSGLNVTDATESSIRGSETVTEAVVGTQVSAEDEEGFRAYEAGRSGRLTPPTGYASWEDATDE